jgi:hypothetical protein
LFIELSDGGRIDIFRRANAGIINNEQIVTAPRINKSKWDELLKDLRKVTDASAKFAFVYLVDDFTASGTTLLRDEAGEWKGKLWRFREDVSKDRVMTSHFEEGWTLCVHHYISTYKSEGKVQQHYEELRHGLGESGWFGKIEFSQGMSLGLESRVTPESHPEFAKLIQYYYDEEIENEHIRKGGENARFGFGQCGLPLILDHNTPNNSIALLWAETEGKKGKHAMRPLFRRRQRHV